MRLYILGTAMQQEVNIPTSEHKELLILQSEYPGCWCPRGGKGWYFRFDEENKMSYKYILSIT